MKRSVETGGFMNIREAGEEDLLWAAETVRSCMRTQCLKWISSFLQLWNSMVQDENHHIVIAQEGKRDCFVLVFLLWYRILHRPAAICADQNVITSEAFRNQGLASACLAFAKQIAVEHHCYKIMLLTGSKKENTLNFLPQSRL